MPPQKKSNGNEYSEENIRRLTPRQHVRLRPGMYIGGTDKRALHQLVWVVLNDVLEEFETAAFQEIVICLLPDRNISIADNGKGIPIEVYTELGVSWLEAYMTKRGQRAIPRLAIDGIWPNFTLWSIGMSFITPLYTVCTAEVKRDGFLWRQTYSEGLSTSPLEQIRPLESGESTGTNITFKPDFSILEENDFDLDLISKRCQEIAYLLPQLRFTILDKRETEHEISYHYPQGLIEWVRANAEDAKPVAEALSIRHTCEMMYRWDKPYQIKVELAFQWFEGATGIIQGFVNLEEPQDGGTHLDALEFALKKYLKVRNWSKLKYGLIGIIHILHPDPQFVSQNQVRLLNSDVYTAVDEAIEALFAAHPEAKAAIQAHFHVK